MLILLQCLIFYRKDQSHQLYFPPPPNILPYSAAETLSGCDLMGHSQADRDGELMGEFN
jgi:hypothetical protein